jgi:Zn-dependent metalloprotease
MKSIKSYYKMLMVLFLSLSFNFALGGDNSSDQKSSTSLGSYKTLKISASPEYSAKYKMPSKGDPVEMAYEFFELNKSLFPIANPKQELIPKYRSFDNLGGVISFQQFYKSIPIQYSKINVRFTGNGELNSVEGDYHYDINISTIPSIDSATAENLALKNLGFPKNAKVFKNEQYSTHLTIWRDNNGKFRLIWVLWVRQEYPDWHSWEYYIDAHDGTVLSKGDIIRK